MIVNMIATEMIRMPTVVGLSTGVSGTSRE